MRLERFSTENVRAKSLLISKSNVSAFICLRFVSTDCNRRLFCCFLTGLHSPLNVEAEAVNDTDFLIISWDFQAEANYSMIHLRSYFNLPNVKGHDTTSAGPTKPYYNGTKCSFCFSDLKSHLSCHALNPGYKFSIGTRLGFQMLVSYKVGACSRNESSSCLDNMWKNYTIPPGGKRFMLAFSARIATSRLLHWTRFFMDFIKDRWFVN